MRWILLLALAGCGAHRARAVDGGVAPDGGDAPDGDVGDLATDDAAIAPGDPYKAVFDAVSQSQLQARLRELTGVDAVTVGGATFKITDRWSVASKAKLRSYWMQYFQALGATVNTLPFAIPNLVGETQGHNLEAILPGASPDSLVVIVHYDTVGITGMEAQNPGADDDGSGLAMQMEAARVFAAVARRHNTVRFVAADYEEISSNLDGDYAYVKYLQNEASTRGFKILAASDDDQTGWSCWSENLCTAGGPTTPNTTFQLITCDGKTHSYPALAQAVLDVAAAWSPTVKPTAKCDNAGDTDHYPFWVAGIPAYVIEEWGSENNPHYDATGGDTVEKIDFSYLWKVAQIQIAAQAKLMGIDAQ